MPPPSLRDRAFAAAGEVDHVQVLLAHEADEAAARRELRVGLERRRCCVRRRTARPAGASRSYSYRSPSSGNSSAARVGRERVVDDARERRGALALAALLFLAVDDSAVRDGASGHAPAPRPASRRVDQPRRAPPGDVPGPQVEPVLVVGAALQVGDEPAVRREARIAQRRRRTGPAPRTAARSSVARAASRSATAGLAERRRRAPAAAPAAASASAARRAASGRNRLVIARCRPITCRASQGASLGRNMALPLHRRDAGRTTRAWLAAPDAARSGAGDAGRGRGRAGRRRSYPAVARGDTVDVYHGSRVADPYRELEAADAPATRRFVDAQNALAQPWLEAIPQRAWIRSRLEALWNYERVGVPRKEGGRYFFLRNDGLQNQSVLYWAAALEATPRVLIDPNLERADATVALARFEPSPGRQRGRVCALRRRHRLGDLALPPRRRRRRPARRAAILQVLGVLVGARRPRRLVQPLSARAARRPARPPTRAATTRRSPPCISIGSASRSRRTGCLRGHRPSDARAVGRVTDDGRWLVITLFDGYRTNGVDLLDLRASGAKPQRLFAAWDALYTVHRQRGRHASTCRPRSGAPRGRVIAVDARRPAPRALARGRAAGRRGARSRRACVGGRVVAQYVRDAHGVARLFDTRRQRWSARSPLPGPRHGRRLRRARGATPRRSSPTPTT